VDQEDQEEQVDQKLDRQREAFEALKANTKRAETMASFDKKRNDCVKMAEKDLAVHSTCKL